MIWIDLNEIFKVRNLWGTIEISNCIKKVESQMKWVFREVKYYLTVPLFYQYSEHFNLTEIIFIFTRIVFSIDFYDACHCHEKKEIKITFCMSSYVKKIKDCRCLSIDIDFHFEFKSNNMTGVLYMHEHLYQHVVRWQTDQLNFLSTTQIYYFSREYFSLFLY